MDENTPNANPAGRHDVNVVVERIDGGGAYDQNARLIDVSPRGARISLSVPVRFNEVVLLRIESAALGVRISAPARVCLIRQQGLAWSLSCSFDPPLSAERLSGLFRHGIVQRRGDSRRAVKAQGTVRWEKRPETWPADLVDVSRGGFRVQCRTSAIPGSRLNLLVDHPDGHAVEIAGTTKWQKKVGGTCLIGCEFVCTESYGVLLETIGETEPEVAVVRCLSPGKLVLHVLAVAFACFCAELTFAAQNPANQEGLVRREFNVLQTELTIEAPEGVKVETMKVGPRLAKGDTFSMQISPASEGRYDEFKERFQSDAFDKLSVVEEDEDVLAYKVHWKAFRQTVYAYVVLVKVGDRTYECIDESLDLSADNVTDDDVRLMVKCAKTLKAK